MTCKPELDLDREDPPFSQNNVTLWILLVALAALMFLPSCVATSGELRTLADRLDQAKAIATTAAQLAGGVPGLGTIAAIAGGFATLAGGTVQAVRSRSRKRELAQLAGTLRTRHHEPSRPARSRS